jgi:RNA polymerase sigma-54 factor
MSLTPQMRQSLNMLGMSVSDLAEYIEFAVTQNPFLQKLIDSAHSSHNQKNNSTSYNDTENDYERTIKDTENPRLSLLSQIKMAGISEKEQEISEYLIFEMDESGYIKVGVEEAAEDLGVAKKDVLKCLSIIQSMEPAGIGAQDITECLQLQLKRQDKEDSLEYQIVSSFLGEVAQDNIEKIAKSIKADKKQIKDAVNAIKKLNPRPASTILSKESNKVIPELLAKVERNKVRIEINRGALPGLKLYNPYENDLGIIRDPEARKFLKDNMGAAKTLIDSIKRREETVCKVADYILEFQKDAIADGKGDIRSLTINDVAKAVKFHPSTISRTVSNKYVQINDKVITLGSLLSHGIKNQNGEMESKTAVKKRIEELIKHEDTVSPLSDSDICEKLKIQGMDINRRTVAKYRQSIRILPSYLRKKVKAL